MLIWPKYRHCAVKSHLEFLFSTAKKEVVWLISALAPQALRHATTTIMLQDFSKDNQVVSNFSEMLS